MKTFSTFYTAFLVIIFSWTCLTSRGQDMSFHADSTVTTHHEVTIKGQKVKFKAVTGTQPVWDKVTGKAQAGVFFTYYERTDVPDNKKRPLFFSFNGGPGAGALWMRLGYTGPHRVLVDKEGHPIQPYGIEENPFSILDVADIVFVEPVNTGYSRTVNGVDPKEFFGVNNDIRYLADWITTFVRRNNRWTSTKYLIGESYGTYRVAGLAHELQTKHWMYVNGVILVSPGWLGLWRYGPVGDANMLPYYAATAWYHKKLPADLQRLDLEELLPKVEDFTIQQFIPALVEGGFIDEEKRKNIGKEVARYMGISEEVVMQHNLVVPMQYFWKELLRKEGYTIGRLDSRYLGIDKKVAGDRPDYAAEYTAWQHTFAPANAFYMTNYLNYHTDHEYYVAGHASWNRFDLENNTGERLRQAMAMNPYLHVLVQAGYYDGATDYFNAKYNLWQMDPSGKLKERMHFKGYRSGHMMYLRYEDLETSNEDLRQFIKASTPAPGTSAKYEIQNHEY